MDDLLIEVINLTKRLTEIDSIELEIIKEENKINKQLELVKATKIKLNDLRNYTQGYLKALNDIYERSK